MVTTLKVNRRPCLCLLSREMVKVMDEEKEKAVIRFFKVAPDYSNEQISQIFKLAPERIARLRAEIDTESRKAKVSSVSA